MTLNFRAPANLRIGSTNNIYVVRVAYGSFSVALKLHVVFNSSINSEVFILLLSCVPSRVAVIGAKNHKRQRRKRQSVTAKQEKSQTPKVLTAILTLPNLT